MKLFWSFLADIYTLLVTSGVKIAPPSFLFNKPKVNIPVRIVEVIHADITFTPEEREWLLQASKDMEFFTNSWFTFDIKFDLDTENYDAFLEESIMLRVDGYNVNIVKSDEVHQNTTIGLCRYWEDGTRDIYMVYDRLHDPTTWRTTAIHELGHFIGMGHTPSRSIMYRHNSRSVLYPTYIDALEFSRLYKCLPKDLRYFKL
jgi:hypothetical protein